jgi:NitT/TauT family transport system substrate-binding protein
MAMDRRAFLGITSAGALALTLPSAALAQAKKLGKIEYGLASLDPIYSAAYIAHKKGLFAEEGLEVEVLNSQSGPRSKQMLAAGQLFVTTTGVNDSIALTLAGKASTLILGFDNRVAFANILVHKDLYESGKVRKVADLAGQTIAVTQPQAATWLMALYILERAGVKDKVEIKGLGDFATMMGAVKTKQVAATIATVSMVDAAKEEGWGTLLFDVSDAKGWDSVFGGELPGVGAYVLAESVKKRPEVIQAFVNAMVKATDVLKTSTPEAIADLVYEPFLSGFPKASVVRGIRVYKQTWNFTNLISKDGYDRLIGVMAGRQAPEADLKKTTPYETMVDMSFVKKARKLG